jgi:hypothetical protein
MGKTDVIGILSIVFAVLFAPIGIVLGIIGIVRNSKAKDSIVLPLIGLIMSVLLLPLAFIIIGAASYFLVLDPATMIPTECRSEHSFACSIASIDAQGIHLSLENRVGRPVELIHLRPGLSECDSITIENEFLASGESTSVRLLGCSMSRTRTDISIIYQYADMPERLNLTSEIQIIGRR